jgi:hypothetical protein
MIDSIENIVRKVILKKYPFLTDVEVRNRYSDLFRDNDSLVHSYTCNFKSEECLSNKEHMMIDTEVKTLFQMLSPESSGFRKPEILCFFDCGEGYEFKMSHGYKH